MPTKQEARAAVARAIRDMSGSYPSQSDRYDITDRTRHQHRTVRDTGHERAILDGQDRRDAIELSRDLHRNDATMRTILWQVAVNVVGPSGGKASFWAADDTAWAEAATSWYNEEFAKRCDGLNLRTHLSTQLATALATMQREGDCLLYFDDSTDDDGRCYWYEADELVQISAADWTRYAVRKGYSQPDPAERRKRIPLRHTSPGIVRDYRGRVTHVVVSSTRKPICTWAEATILPIDSVALVRLPFRFGQHRGTAPAWAVHDTLVDIKEGQAEELRSLRELNKKALVVKSDSDVDEQLSRFGTSIDEVISEVEGGADPAEILKDKRYEALESLYEHASTTYIGKDGSIDVVESDRPSPSMQGFWEDQRVLAGASFGLARCYTLLKVSNNFSSARAEFVISWATFAVLQKLLERLVCDWLAEKAVAWAIRHGELPAAPARWSVSFSWPKMPMIDVGKEISGLRDKIAAGMSTWQEVLGPDYRKLFDQLAKEMGELKEAGLDRLLDVFFTVSGASKEQTAADAVADAVAAALQDNGGIQ